MNYYIEPYHLFLPRDPGAPPFPHLLSQRW